MARQNMILTRRRGLMTAHRHGRPDGSHVADDDGKMNLSGELSRASIIGRDAGDKYFTPSMRCYARARISREEQRRANITLRYTRHIGHLRELTGQDGRASLN